MSMIEVTKDVKNPLLSRREITCNFKGLSGRLKKLEAVDMISKKFNLEGKIVIPILLKNETGRPVVSGSFYIYEDEKLAKEHLKAAIFARIEKAKGGGAKAEGESPVEQAEAPAKKEKDPAEKAKAPKEESK
jgi:ribosomal protein S24E